MKMKKPQIRTSWTAVLAALGATAAMLPAHAQSDSVPGTAQWGQSVPPGAQGRGLAGPPPGSQDLPAISTQQPEMGNAPGQQGQDAAGSAMQGGQQQGGMGMGYSDKPMTSTHQPEMSVAPGEPHGPSGLPPDGQQSRDAQGMGMQGGAMGSQQGQDATGSTMQGGQQQQGGMGMGYSDKPMTSTHQPEMSVAPGEPRGPSGLYPEGQQSRDAQGMGMQGGAMGSQQGGMGMQGGQQQGDSMGMQGGQQQQGGMGMGYSDKPMTSTHQPEMSVAPGRPYGPGPLPPDAQRNAQSEQRSLTREEVRAETEAWREAGLLELMDAEDSSVWMDPEVQRTRRQVQSQVQAQRGMSEPGYGTRDAGGGMGSGWQQQQPMPSGGGR